MCVLSTKFSDSGNAVHILWDRFVPGITMSCPGAGKIAKIFRISKKHAPEIFLVLPWCFPGDWTTPWRYPGVHGVTARSFPGITLVNFLLGLVFRLLGGTYLYII